MRISDWSSDVCSSDLGGCRAGRRRLVAPGRGGQPHQQPGLVRLAQLRLSQAQRPDRGDGAVRGAEERTAAVGASEEGGGAAEAGAEEGGRLRNAGRMFVAPFLGMRSEEHTSELQSLMRISYA